MGYDTTSLYGLRTPQRSNKPTVSADLKQLADDTDKAIGSTATSINKVVSDIGGVEVMLGLYDLDLKAEKKARETADTALAGRVTSLESTRETYSGEEQKLRTSVEGVNLLNNGGPEKSIAGWTPNGSFAPAVFVADAGDGKPALQYTGKGSISSVSFPVQAGRKYRISYRVKALQENTPMTLSVVFTRDIGTSWWYNVNRYGVLGTDWVDVTRDFTALADNNFVSGQVRIAFQDGGAAVPDAVIQVRDVVLVEVPSGSVSAVELLGQRLADVHRRLMMLELDGSAYARASEAYDLASSAVPLDTGWVDLDYTDEAKAVLDTSKVAQRRNNAAQIRRVGERVYVRGWVHLAGRPEGDKLFSVPVGYRALAPADNAFYSYQGSFGTYGNSNPYTRGGSIVYSPWQQIVYAVGSVFEASIWRDGIGFTMFWIAEDEHPLQK